MNTPEDQVLPATVQPVNDDTGLLRLQAMDDIDSMISLRLDGGKTLTLKASEALLTTYKAGIASRW